MVDALVEVRIPTYNRPDLLRRALHSVRAQTHHNWRAIILDDGDAARTRQIVDDLGDPRISHRPNRVRLGAGRNISLAFSMTPLVGGEFFHALEDDNYLAPSFIADNLYLLSRHDVGLVVNNQWVEHPLGESDLSPPRHDIWTTIDCFTEGVWTADDFRIALLWRLPISNGGIFWRSNCRSDLAIDDVADAGLQEWLRCTRLSDAVYFNDKPNAFWRPASNPEMEKPNIPMFLKEHRIQQIIRRRVLLALQARGEMWKLSSDRFRTPLALREEGVLKTYGRWPAPSNLRPTRRIGLLAKALAIRWLTPSPAPPTARALAVMPS